ncbi:MAG TPA: phosphotransferase, partial [Actinotalea sp.]|nr:phosphotransferase [Actinotalea sp.]
AMLDFGALTAGDPATDLAAGWLCFGAAARERFWAEYLQLADLAGEGAALRRRARAWAASFAAILLGEPAHAGFVTVGEHAREQIAADLR